MIKLSQNYQQPLSKIKFMIQLGSDILSIKEFFDNGYTDKNDTADLIELLYKRVQEFGESHSVKDEGYKQEVDQIPLDGVDNLELAERIDTTRLFKMLMTALGNMKQIITTPNLDDTYIRAALNGLYESYVERASVVTGVPDIKERVENNHVSDNDNPEPQVNATQIMDTNEPPTSIRDMSKIQTPPIMNDYYAPPKREDYPMGRIGDRVFNEKIREYEQQEKKWKLAKLLSSIDRITKVN